MFSLCYCYGGQKWQLGWCHPSIHHLLRLLDWAVEPTLGLNNHCKSTLSMLFDLLFLGVLDSYCVSLPMLSLHARPGSDGFLLGDRFLSDGSLSINSIHLVQNRTRNHLQRRFGQGTSWQGHERWGQFKTIYFYNTQLMMPILVLYDTLRLPAPAWQ